MSIAEQIIGAIHGFPVNAETGEMQPDINPWTGAPITPTNPWLHKGTIPNDEDETAILSASRAAIEKALAKEESPASIDIGGIFAKRLAVTEDDTPAINIHAELAAANTLGDLGKKKYSGTPAKWSGNEFSWNDEVFAAPTTSPVKDGKKELATDAWTPELESAITEICKELDRDDYLTEKEYFQEINRRLVAMGHRPALSIDKVVASHESLVAYIAKKLRTGSTIGEIISQFENPELVSAITKIATQIDARDRGYQIQ
jgi:hypothetical protein